MIRPDRATNLPEQAHERFCKLDMHLLVVSPSGHSLPCEAGEINRRPGWRVTTAENYRQAVDHARSGEVDAIILPAPCTPEEKTSPDANTDFHTLIRLIDAQRIATLLLSDDTPPVRPDPRSLVEVVPRDITPAELRGRLAMIDRYHGVVKRLEQELHNMERLSKRLNLHFREIDQEMRLAGRLQRDFLPDTRQPIGNLRFASVFRPASWVSGDMFDIFRIDETRSGVYIADAVGHGMAAGLLTMFIKRAIVPKRVDGDGYTVLSPSEIISVLNNALADQSLPQCQFVTAAYALIDHRTLEFQYARGGHPYPILITADGIVSEMKSPGGLLGLFKGEDFPTFGTKLEPGDKVVFYTDGVEMSFQADPEAALDTRSYIRFFEEHAALPIDELMGRVEHRLDSESGSLHPRDDLSIVGFEVLRDAVRAG
jgi:sigma-B regulation protein RsbU (phosphoserine phosphatase)